MNAVFSDPRFWQPYFSLEPVNLRKADLTRQLDGLAEDFVVRDRVINYESGGEPRTATDRLVEFSFTCGDRFALVVEYVPDIQGCEKTLYLADSASSERCQLGWWDLARWHPYCLHPDEFDILLDYWQRTDPRWPQPELPLLLLCDFVGLSHKAELNSLSARAEAAWRTIGLPSPGKDQAVPLHVPEDGSHWEVGDELGRVFTSDDYGCYSIRNRPHGDSTEGRFPFAAFNEMMAEVRR